MAAGRRWMMQRYQQQSRVKKGEEEDEVSNRAATDIQRVYRGYLARKLVKKYREKEDTLIGMIMPRYIDFSYRVSTSLSHTATSETIVLKGRGLGARIQHESRQTGNPCVDRGPGPGVSPGPRG